MLTLRRPQPCNNCRKHRRKCVKPGYDSPCVRCARLQHPCTSSSESESEEVIEDDLLDGSNDVNAMWDQVQQMQEIMKQLELSMKQAQRVRSGYLIQPSTPPDDDTDTDYDSDSVGLLRSGDHSDYRWEISVVDGRFQLETPIQSFHEMLAYGRAAIRYLSPFQDLFHDTNLVFELSQAKDSVLALLFDMIAKSSKAITAPPAALLPNQRTLLESPRVVVDTLVDLYFACQNKTIPFVNEATYMAHYAKLRDPTTCAVTMGICVVVTSSVCKHVPFAPAERRRLAEYFFEICENRLYDIFDEPDHRLETVITIHLVSSFLRNTLKTAKTRKWSTISKLICDDLSQTAQFKSQDERILFSRHHVVSALISQFLDYLIDKSDSDCPPKIVDEIAPIALQPMSSECGITIELLEIMDYVVKLSTTPCMRHSFRQICRMHMAEGYFRQFRYTIHPSRTFAKFSAAEFPPGEGYDKKAGITGNRMPW
ncbi:hypothetical protein DFQ28_010571 [Apophysomyces sp. BC1034]|nr:hypothetical protein DFQ29_002565 [Apophysomyces sp. BC1021]KAG0194487.1 hypothetical protein DFQ28_010571 [Apophysomyces sp. BC1034]